MDSFETESEPIFGLPHTVTCHMLVMHHTKNDSYRNVVIKVKGRSTPVSLCHKHKATKMHKHKGDFTLFNIVENPLD